MKTLTSSAALVLASSLAIQALSLSPSPVLDAREPGISYGPQPCHPDPYVSDKPFRTAQLPKFGDK